MKWINLYFKFAFIKFGQARDSFRYSFKSVIFKFSTERVHCHNTLNRAQNKLGIIQFSALCTVRATGFIFGFEKIKLHKRPRINF
jgi:hypothetical protein